MRRVERTGQFKRDVKRSKDFSEFRRVVGLIASGESLEPRRQDHPLQGAYKGARECHLEPDWLLIYERSETQIILIRTGTHADLFGK